MTGEDQHSQSRTPGSPVTDSRAIRILRALGRSLTWLFVNAVERRMRAGWRVAAYVVVFICATFVVQAAAVIPITLLRQMAPSVAAGLLDTTHFEGPGWLLVYALSMCVAITASVWMARRLFDRRSFVSLGVAVDRRAGVDLAWGIACAGVIQALLFGACWATGWIRVQGVAWQTQPAGSLVGQLVLMALILVPVAWYEELMARGYLLVNLSEGLGRPLGVLLSSLLFAIAHSRNPEAGWPAMLGLLVIGSLFAWAALRSGRLWLPIGMHFAWNFFEGPVLGFPISGLQSVRLLDIAVSGPALWTGGAFGPEAGLVLLPACVLGGLLVYLATRARSARLLGV